MNLMMWIGPVVGVGALVLAWRSATGASRQRARAAARAESRVRREAIDIDLVLEEKYPNRKAARLRKPLVTVAAVAPPGAAPLDVEFETPDLAEPHPELTPAPEPQMPADPKAWPDRTRPAGFIAPPPLDTPPWAPLPGEPGGDSFVGPPRRPSTVADTPEGPALVASPYEALRRRRDRVARQAAAAFADVHRLRTESLRRASQAEHNAELATSARVRATRMARESRRYEAQGRQRSVAVPNAGDAFHDVHRFRVEALRRAHEAEHGADSVAQARLRATRLLAEQRKIEAEMAKLRRGVAPVETL